MAKPIPEGYHSVTPYLVVDDAAKAIEFYKKAFGAEEKCCGMPMGDKIGHAEIKIGDSSSCSPTNSPRWDICGPKARGGTTVEPDDLSRRCRHGVPDARSTPARSRAEAARRTNSRATGSGTLIDPFGHKWSLATHVEDVSGRRNAAADGGILRQAEAVRAGLNKKAPGDRRGPFLSRLACSLAFAGLRALAWHGERDRRRGRVALQNEAAFGGEVRAAGSAFNGCRSASRASGSARRHGHKRPCRRPASRSGPGCYPCSDKSCWRRSTAAARPAPHWPARSPSDRAARFRRWFRVVAAGQRQRPQRAMRERLRIHGFALCQ